MGCRTLSGPEEESRLRVITESFPEQLTFLHEFEQCSLEKSVLDCRHCPCKGPEAGGWGRSRTECGRQTYLECQGRGLGCVPAVLKGAVVASEGWEQVLAGKGQEGTF